MELGGFFKMNDLARELVKKIDDDMEQLLKEQPEAKIGEAVQPFIKKYAEEAGIDEIDLFIDYMDHVALTSKRLGTAEGGDKMFTDKDLDNPDFRLY
jgi:hypothetical protein